MTVAVLLTCHNRREKTVNCIESLSKNRTETCFVVVDDGSSDGTVDTLNSMKEHMGAGKELVVMQGDGNLFYSGGMRRAMVYVRDHVSADFVVLVNDDVEFEAGILDKVIDSGLKKDHAYVGAMKDKTGRCSYGGIKYISGIHYQTVTPQSEDRNCDTFNANFVVIPENIFWKVPVIDPNYIHSLGDFDYGLSIKSEGYSIEVLDFYAGICENNPSSKTWMDTSLSRKERLKKKESVKGAPFKPWFYFLKKNFGIVYALVYSITPYIRIIIGK